MIRNWIVQRDLILHFSINISKFKIRKGIISIKKSESNNYEYV